MNYLSHYVYNHQVCGQAVQPYFVLGVALPDLWSRFSRSRRIRWRAVRAAEPQAPAAQRLRAGLLNHVDVDRAFHTAPTFLRWQRRLKDAISTDGVHPALVDFVVHAGVELALDHNLLRRQPDLADEFYDAVSACSPVDVAGHVSQLGDVDTAGLEDVLRQFFARRFLRSYRTPEGLVCAMQLVLGFIDVPQPPRAFIAEVFRQAVEMSDPAAVWPELASCQTSSRAASADGSTAAVEE